MYMWNLAEDLIYGKIREKGVVKYLNKNKFKSDNLNLYQNEKKQVDFRNNEIIGELKSRTCKYTAFSTTMFGYNKIKYLKSLENDNRKWFFYFLFTDGLYVWEYNENEYIKNDYMHKERGIIDQAYIDIKFLKCITKDINSINIINYLNQN